MNGEGGVSVNSGRGGCFSKKIGGASRPKNSHTAYRLMGSRVNFSVVMVNLHLTHTTIAPCEFPQFSTTFNKLIKTSLSNMCSCLLQRRTLCFCLQGVGGS